MSRIEQTVWCDNCGVEITWGPIVRVGQARHRILHFCCMDCLAGRACKCGERLELEDERRTSSVQTYS
ncbi:MAG: Archaeal domain [Chloroflexi bacterium]|nr:Archaeal domain [Chloroflexota bacterium]